MTNTPNYDLLKPSPTGDEDVHQSLSENFDKIDTQMKDSADKVGSVKAEVEAARVTPDGVTQANLQAAIRWVYDHAAGTGSGGGGGESTTASLVGMSSNGTKYEITFEDDGDIVTTVTDKPITILSASVAAQLQDAIDAYTSIQAQVNSLASGDSSTAANQAKVDENNVDHPTLKARIDNGMTSLSNKIGNLSSISWLPPSLVQAITDLRNWMIQNAINVCTPPYNAVGDGVANDTTAIQTALNTGRHIYLPYSKTFKVSNLITNSSNQQIVAGANATLISDGTAGSIVKLAHDYAKLIGVTISGSTGGATSGVETTGFRNTLSDVTVSGTTQYALNVNGLETNVDYGRFKGGTVAGIYVQKPDLYMANVYVEGNQYGVYSNGYGSITAHHVHAFNNTLYGFYLIGASYSQLNSCYADTNGSYGWIIQDTTSGMTLVDCWGYKSANTSANRSDFDFRNAKNIKMFGCHSNGAGGQTKSASFSFDATSQVDMIGCHGEIAPTGITGLISITNSGGALQRYNRPTDVFESAAFTIGVAANATVTTKTTIPAILSSPSVMSFEVTAIMRDNDALGTRPPERFFILTGTGVTITQAVTTVFPASPTLALSSVTFTDADADGLYDLGFTVTNNGAKSIQVAFHIRYLGTSRGFN